MNSINPTSGRRRAHNSALRAQLLAEFDRSGLSAAAFVRQHRLNYTTFCGWRYRRARTKDCAAPAFVEVELPAPCASAQLVIELGTAARLVVHSARQIELASKLIQSLNRPSSC